MLDSRDNLEFETDWLRIFQQSEQKSFSTDELTATKAVREIAYKKTFDATNHSELSAYAADDFELIAKSLLSGFSDEWLNALISSYLHGIFPHSKAESLIAERAKRGSREKFLEFMADVPDVEPDERDRLT